MSEFQMQAITLREQIKLLKVVDVFTYAQAGEMLKLLKEMEKKIVNHYKPLKQAVDESKKKILAQEKAELEPVQLADALIRQQVTTYLNEEEKKRKEVESRLMREAEEKAEKEQAKLLNRAATAESKGQIDKAENLLEQAEDVYVAPVAVSHVVDKTINGVTRKTETMITVADLKKFLLAIIDQSPAAVPGIIDVRPGALKAWVKANGVESFPGLVIEEKASISVRA